MSLYLGDDYDTRQSLNYHGMMIGNHTYALLNCANASDLKCSLEDILEIHFHDFVSSENVMSISKLGK